MSTFNHWTVRASQKISKFGFFKLTLPLVAAIPASIGVAFLTGNPSILLIALVAAVAVGFIMFTWNAAHALVENYAREHRKEYQVDSVYDTGFRNGKPYVQAIEHRTRRNVVLEFVGQHPYVNRFSDETVAV